MPTRDDHPAAVAAGLSTTLFADLVVMGRAFRVDATFGGGDTVFGLKLGDLSLGDIVRYMVSLVPGPDNFKLDAPWTVLNEINLRDLEFTFNATQGKVGFTYRHLNLDLAFVRIDDLELWYGPKDARSSIRTLEVRLFGRFLDKTYAYPDQPLSWELLKQPAPAVPSGAPKTFDLDYLGLGQHVTLRDTAKLTTMKGLIDGLVGSYEPVADDANPLTQLRDLKFDASAGWLVGVRFSVLDTVYLSVIFNDPNLYGLRVELAGERAQIFAGLQFEILYRRITDEVGVFHAELQLPDAMRRLELGAISITLPVVVVDIYTNGDFLIDLGFPYNLDFRRSFTLQMFIGPVPVVGAGGVRFGVMSGLMSAEVPRITNGRFAPVLVFGLGLQLGVGKSLSLGILSGGVLIALEGLLEGVLAFFEPEDASLPRSTFYRLHGTIQISAHVYGRINFAIIQAAVDVYAYASVSGTLQAHEAMVLVIEAGVTASVSVKVVFFTVKLSFSATVRETITIGRATTAPWRIALGDAQAAARAKRRGFRRLVDGHVVADDAYAGLLGRPLAWRGMRVASELRTLDLYLQPIVSLGRTADYPPPARGAAAGADSTAVQLLVNVFVPLGNPDPQRGAGFEELARAELLWALATIHEGLRGVPPLAPEGFVSPSEVTRSALEFVMADLTSERRRRRRAGHSHPRQPVGLGRIVDFLRENFQLRIRPMPADAQAQARMAEEGLTLFPMPPYLTLETAAPEHRADFQTFNSCGADYITVVQEYFRQLSVPVNGQAPDRAARTATIAHENDMAPDSMAAFVFGDYFTMVLRQIVHASLEVFDGLVVTPEPGTTLEELVSRYAVAGEDPVARIALANQDNAEFFATGTTLTFTGLLAQVRAGESLRTFAQRVTLEPLTLVTALRDLPGLLNLGASMTIPASEAQAPSTAIVHNGDTWASIASEHALTVADLVSDRANLDSTELLAKQFTFRLPPVESVVSAGAEASPLAIARRFDLDAEDVVRLNSVPPVGFGTVRLPEFERLPVTDLFAKLHERKAFDAAAATVARCLMGGLRLPDPQAGRRMAEYAALAHGADPWSDVRLYPLAILTGQQWLAPAAPAAGYTMTLSKNALADDPAPQRPAIVFDSDHPDHDIAIALGAEDVALAQAYAGLLKRPDGPFDPALLTSARLGPYTIAERRYPLGTGRAWATPHALPLGEVGQSTGLPMLFALPNALREQLGRSPSTAPDLRVMTGPPGVPGAPAPEAREIAARAWGTRIRFSLNRVESPEDAKTYIPGLYSVFGSDLEGPRLLLQVIEAFRADASIAPRLDILYPANATDPMAAALQSDPVVPEQVLLAKANVSTETHPPAMAMRARLVGTGVADVSHATLAEPMAFLTLLWEACITNAGGFYLRYHIGDGQALPPQLFNQTTSASLELLITAFDTRTSTPVRAGPHHNAVVCAENLGAASPNVFVAPPRLVVGAGATFKSLSATLGTTVDNLAAANATQRDLARPGITIALPVSGAYTVQVGDTLLDIALREAMPSVAVVAAAVDAVASPLVTGAELNVHGGWVYRRPVVPPGVVGFRILRTNPEPGAAEGEHPPGPVGDAAPGTRLQTLFNLLAYRLRASAGFRASPYGLPVAPAQDPKPTPAVAVRAPWRYSRMLGIEPYAIAPPGSDAMDPPSRAYVGVGGSATIEFDLLDVFGNRCLPPGRVPPLEVPIRYSDPVFPVSQWPSVTSTYDVPAPGQIAIRLGFDAGRYVPSADATLACTIARVRADRELVARIEAQIQQADVRLTVTATFGLVDQQIEKGRLLALLRDIQRYLGTVGALEPVEHRIGKGEDLQRIAEAFHLPVETLAAAIADDSAILATGSEYTVPHLHVFVLNDTLDSICARVGADLTPALLAARNEEIPLEPVVTLTIGGKTVAVKAGDTLDRLARSHDTTSGKIGKQNSAVPNLFSSGTQVLLWTTHESVPPGSTLSELARTHGVSLNTLAAANARETALLRQGRRIQIPEHVRVGADRAATYQVRPGDSLRSVAEFLHVTVGGFAVANLDVEDILHSAQPPVEMSYLPPGARDVVVERVLEHDTLGTILRRLRSKPGCANLSVEDLAEQNQASDELLTHETYVLAPPEDAVEIFTPGFRPPDAIFPVTIALRIERDVDLVDPALRDDPAMSTAATDLTPYVTRTRGSIDDAVSLRAFARRFERGFPGLRLATAADAPHEQMPTRPLTAVSCPDKISYAIEQVPYFFAPRPLLNRLWASEPGHPVPVPSYANGIVTEGTNTDFSGIDLDNWGREILAAVDRFLSPQFGIAACDVLGAGADYDRIVAAKAALAWAVRQQVVAVVEAPPRSKEPDLEAAREALYQRMLIELSAGYDVDAVVQFRVAVRSPYTTRSTAPRFNGKVSAVSLAIPEHSTLRGLAQRFEAPLATFGAFVADTAYLLEPGFEVSMPGGRTHVIEPGDTLRSVAAAVDVPLPALIDAYATDPRLLHAGANLGLVTRRRRTRADDTLGTLIDSLDRGTPLTDSMPTFLAMNGDSPRLLRPDADLALVVYVVRPGETLDAIAAHLGTTPIALGQINCERQDLLLAGATIELAGGDTYTIREGDSLAGVVAATRLSLAKLMALLGPVAGILRQGARLERPEVKRHRVAQGETLQDVARAMGVSALELLEGCLDEPDIVAEFAEVRYLSRLPGFSVSTAKLVLADGQSSLTFLFDLATSAAFTSLGVDLDYAISEVEYDIEDPGVAPGYQQSRWLSLVEPIRHDRLPRIDIPIPLRSYPTPPVMLSQDTRQAVPESPTLDHIKTYDYVYTYAYSPAAQDQVRTDVETNVAGGGERMMAADPSDTLPYWLARYHAIAAALWSDLAPLGEPQALRGSQQLLDAARGAVSVFAHYAAEIARVWQPWSGADAPQARACSNARFQVQCRPTGGGHVRVSGPTGAGAARDDRHAAPTMHVRHVLPPSPPLVVAARGRRAGGRRARQAPAPPISSAALPDLVLTHRVRSLDVLREQNIRGFVDVERNRELLPARATRPDFVYTADRVQAPSLTWPLVTYRAPYDMTAVPPLRSWPDPRTPLHRLAGFFADLLDIKPDSPAAQGHPLRIGLSFLYPLNETERERLLIDGSTPAILSEIPIALQGVADFEPARDLLAADGVCPRLAQRMESWAGDNPALVSGRAGYFTFDITVYSNLPSSDGSSTRRPLLSLPSVRLSLADVDLGSPKAESEETASRRGTEPRS